MLNASPFAIKLNTRYKNNFLCFNLFHRSKLSRANVHFLSPPVKDGTTGTVIVLTTPDAQRTMLAYQVNVYLNFFSRATPHVRKT